MLEHLNIQAIAKWFEKGCNNSNDLVVNSKNGEKGFYFLECDDLCLLSKLPDVKNKTLLDRAHKRLKQIRDPISRKDFLLAISKEFLREGRKPVSLKMLSTEIDNETELYKLFKSDLLLNRALCYFELEKPAEALCDLYLALEAETIQKLNRIHVQILEELKKCLSKNQISEEYIMIKDRFQLTFKEILKRYETEIFRLLEQQIKEEEKCNNGEEELRQFHNESISADGNGDRNWKGKSNLSVVGNQTSQDENKISKPNPRSELTWAATVDQGMGFRNNFAVTWPNANSNINTISRKLIKKRSTNNGSGASEGAGFQRMAAGALAPSAPGAFNNAGRLSPAMPTFVTKFNKLNNNGCCLVPPRELRITYSVDNRKQISVKQILNEPIIDNIFNLRGILVGNVCDHYEGNTIYEIFETFGTIINIKQKDNSNKLIIEYNNTDSPRFAISYLSQVELPFVSKDNKYLEFRFYKGEGQKNFRICKQNQIKTSSECYFWRTTGCQNYDCPFYHNRLAMGVDYQEWMKIDLNEGNRQPATANTIRSYSTSTANNAWSPTPERIMTNKMAMASRPGTRANHHHPHQTAK